MTDNDRVVLEIVRVEVVFMGRGVSPVVEVVYFLAQKEHLIIRPLTDLMAFGAIYHQHLYLKNILLSIASAGGDPVRLRKMGWKVIY